MKKLVVTCKLITFDTVVGDSKEDGEIFSVNHCRWVSPIIDWSLLKLGTYPMELVEDFLIKCEMSFDYLTTSNPLAMVEDSSICSSFLF